MVLIITSKNNTSMKLLKPVYFTVISVQLVLLNLLVLLPQYYTYYIPSLFYFICVLSVH